MARPVHRLRHLQAFLRHERDLLEQDNAHWLSWAFGATSFFIVAALVLSRFSVLALIILAVLSPLIFLQIASIMAKHRESLGLGWSSEGKQALGEIRGFNRDGTLEERTDVEIGDLLNSCCQIYREVRGLLKSDEWENAKGTKLEAKTAAESALGALFDDALVISLSGIRSKGQRRDAFAKRMADPSIKGPILESLEDIRGELERLKTEISLASVTTVDDAPYTQALDRIAEIRRAEEELRDTFRA